MISSPAGKSPSARSRTSRKKVFSALSETTIALNVCGKAMRSLLISDKFFSQAVPNVEANCQEPQKRIRQLEMDSIFGANRAGRENVWQWNQEQDSPALSPATPQSRRWEKKARGLPIAAIRSMNSRNIRHSKKSPIC